MINQLFTTPLWHRRLSPAPADVSALAEYLLGLRQETAGERRSNEGGWHSSGNLFNSAEHRVFPFLNDLVRSEVIAYLAEVFAFRGNISFSPFGWAVINGPGNWNAPHNHTRNLFSGAFYLQVPAEMSGGEIVFMDPRANANAYGSAEMLRIGLVPPWDASHAPHRPMAGDILLFPSWLQHYVRPFETPDPQALRIVISFNVAV